MMRISVSPLAAGLVGMLVLGLSCTARAQDAVLPYLVSSQPASSQGRTNADAAAQASRTVEVLFQDDFGSGMGAWSVSDRSGSGAQWADWDCWASTGARSAGCAAGGVAASGCSEDYPPLLKTWMIYGPFSLEFGENYSWAECAFDYVVDTEIGFDRLVVASSTDGIRFSGIEFEGVGGGSTTLDLSDMRHESQVWVGFQFTSDHADGRPIGASIDHVIIRRDDPPPPPPTPTALSYGWTISDRDDDPWSVRTSAGGSGATTLYLWYTCDDAVFGGASGLESILTGHHASIVSFTPLNGTMNAGVTPSLQLTLPSCITAPFLVGEISANMTGASQVCLEESFGLGRPMTLDCDPDGAQLRPTNFLGYWTTDETFFSCGSDSLCGADVTPVEPRGWAQIKSWYR